MTDDELLERLRERGGRWPVAAADRIEQLTAERERLSREVNVAKYGQPDFAWSVHLSAMAELQAERDWLREALTPSGATKAAYIGEISIPVPGVDGDGVGFSDSINIPWTAIKQVMAMISARAALKGEMP